MSQERSVEAPGPHGPLRGMLRAPPKSGAPVVLIIPGSGPTDRDGNSPLGIHASTYKLIAEGLAGRDIASVRVDKRGLFSSRCAIADANAVTIADYAADVRAWITLIEQEVSTSGVWVLGHSEGGLVALAAAQDAPSLCGLVLVSVAGRPLGELLREQIASTAETSALLPQAEDVIGWLEAGQKVDEEQIPPELRPLFRAEVQGFLMSSFALDPARLIASIEQPALIIQGLRDLQVGRVDAERLSSAQPKAGLVLLKEINHVLKHVPQDDRAANIAAYQDPDLPIASSVIDAITTFVKDR